MALAISPPPSTPHGVINFQEMLKAAFLSGPSMTGVGKRWNRLERENQVHRCFGTRRFKYFICLEVIFVVKTEADGVVESNRDGGKIETDDTRSTYSSAKFRIKIIEIVYAKKDRSVIIN